MKDIFEIIDTIQVSEKAAFLAEMGDKKGRKTYVFKVDRRANKLEIREAVEKLFGKKVVGVRTANYQGKKKRERRADYGRTKHWKKAFVKLDKGEVIEIV